MNGIDTRIIVLFAIAVIAVILISTVLLLRKRKSGRLKQHYGPEYDRIVGERGDSRYAEAVLAEREKRVEKFSVRRLTPEERDRYAAAWMAVQKQFVDDPSLAVTEADRLVNAVMATRGYPMADFEQRAADISVSYPGVVENYRAARAIVVRDSGQETTEDLRQALVYYRSLFDELLDMPVSAEKIAENTENKNPKRGVSHARAS